MNQRGRKTCSSVQQHDSYPGPEIVLNITETAPILSDVQATGEQLNSLSEKLVPENNEGSNHQHIGRGNSRKGNSNTDTTLSQTTTSTPTAVCNPMAGPSGDTAIQQNEAPRNNPQPRTPQEQQNGNRGEELQSELKFAFWVGGLSFAAIMTIIGAKFGNLTERIKRVPYGICMVSLVVAFIFSLLLLMATIIHVNFKSLRTIVNTAKCLAMGFLVLAVGSGVAMAS